MTVVAHISDLHFGTEQRPIVEALLEELSEVDVVVVSGDLTQRAKRSEFAAYGAFIGWLGRHVLVVPGNHDVPLYNLAARFLTPLRRYRREVTPDLAPVIAHDNVVIAGIATAYGSLSNNGRITSAMADAVCARLRTHAEPWKLVVAHHPFELPVPTPRHNGRVVRGAAMALPKLQRAGVSAILSGHLHIAWCSPDPTVRPAAIYAGTATSSRVRGEGNSYNRIALGPSAMIVTVRRWSDAGFVTGSTTTYPKH